MSRRIWHGFEGAGGEEPIGTPWGVGSGRRAGSSVAKVRFDSIALRTPSRVRSDTHSPPRPLFGWPYTPECSSLTPVNPTRHPALKQALKGFGNPRSAPYQK